MRDSIGGVYLFNIVILFIILFTGIMCMTVNRTKAYSVKDAMIQAIELNSGVETTAFSGEASGIMVDIGEIASNFAYRETGDCNRNSDEKNYIGFDRTGKQDSNSSNTSICVRKVIVNKSEDVFALYDEDYYLSGEAPSGCYYSVKLFYSLGIPILKEVFSFSVQGETKTVYGENCK